MFSDPFDSPKRDWTADNGKVDYTDTITWHRIKLTDSYNEYASPDIAKTGYTLQLRLRLGHYPIAGGRTRHSITMVGTRIYDDPEVEDEVTTSTLSITAPTGADHAQVAELGDPLVGIHELLHASPTDWVLYDRFLLGER